MRTLIKWPGGKKSEIKNISNLIPNSYNNYVEPFFGGGALFFHLEPEKAYINDRCEELISFYKFIVDEKKIDQFRQDLMDYAISWSKIDNLTKTIENELICIYKDYCNNNINLEEKIDYIINNSENFIFETFPESILIDPKDLKEEFKNNLISKIKRTNKIDLSNSFSRDEIQKNLETAIRSGFYMYSRNIMNKSKFKELNIPETKRIANYYFVREFCYGSMFRFNKKGEFNIPYGGMSYNNKNFAEKVNLIFSKKTADILNNTIIECLDFEEFLNKFQFQKNDFIFFDPPYDTDFCNYEDNSFTRDDQERLSKCIADLKARYILVIKNTDFILDLYKNNENAKIEFFDKNYSYNVKGRNNREVQHLIVHNLHSNQSNLNRYY